MREGWRPRSKFGFGKKSVLQVNGTWTLSPFSKAQYMIMIFNNKQHDRAENLVYDKSKLMKDDYRHKIGII
jgi:hypothetical protein